VHHRDGRDEAQRQVVARLDVRPGTVLHPVALGQAGRAEDVALLAVRVVQQRDPRRAVRVVLDVRDLGRHAVLVRPAEVDQPVGPLVATALVPGGDAAVHVPAAPRVQRAHQRLLRLTPGDLGEVRAARAAPARGSRLVLTDSHVWSSPLGAENVDPVALGEGDNRALGIRPLAPAVPGATPLARPVHGVHPGHLDPEPGLDREPDLGLVGVGGDDEGVLALVEQPGALLRDHRPKQDVSRVAVPALLAVSFAAPDPDARATNAVRACSVKITWSLASTSYVLSWSSVSTWTLATLRSDFQVSSSSRCTTTS